MNSTKMSNLSSVSCSTCGKEFSKKSGLEKHKVRKNPCKAPKALIESTVNKTLETVGLSHLGLSEFREVSKKFNSSLTKEQRQEEGIYFTPKKARDVLFDTLKKLGVTPKTILEPSFGSGEFLLDAKRIYPTAKLLGVEKNQELFNAVQCAEATLSCSDFLEWKGKADLIIGNPPYFVMGSKKQYPCMTGRPNIYVLFLYKCLEEHLEKNGFLAFIIPTSLYNASYYQPMRDYIYKNTTIHHLENLNKPGFFETGQEVMLIVLQKKKMNDNYIFKAKNDNIYISPFYEKLYALTENTKTIQELGLGVKTGNIVWNQIKDNLTEKSTNTLLIYSSNIVDSKLVLDNLKGGIKKQYVKGITKSTLTGPHILVERGYGNSIRFNSVLVNLKSFYAENHVNVIYPKKKEDVKHLEKVLTSLQDERTLQFVSLLLSNGSISSTDMETLIPIY